MERMVYVLKDACIEFPKKNYAEMSRNKKDMAAGRQ